VNDKAHVEKFVKTATKQENWWFLWYKINVMNVILKEIVSRKTEKVHEDDCQIKENHRLNLFCSTSNSLPRSYYCKVCMNQQSPKHQLFNRLNNACVEFNLCIYILLLLHHFKLILCIKCNIWHLYCTKSIPKCAYYNIMY